MQSIRGETREDTYNILAYAATTALSQIEAR
jgi:hypothetical protein